MTEITSTHPSRRCFVGFGFGPIQSGLFFLEAFLSGHFSRLVAAEVDQGLVDAVRSNGNAFTVNIAHPDRIEPVHVTGVELLNPNLPADRDRLVQAIRDADELATALPSVDFYARGGSSVARLLVEALTEAPAKPRLLYTAENNNHAAEILEQAIRQQTGGTPIRDLQLANTVIGKMSGVLTDPDEIQRLGLVPLAPGVSKAILVEAFNRIVISRVTLANFTRGITVFRECDHLLALEEAKLYGHNAVHALIGFLAWRQGLTSMAQAAGVPSIMACARHAFLDESGAMLLALHARTGDPLFTPAGFKAYTDDLLVRMVNPYLNDRVDRVIRDPGRKLGWSDRIFGTMRLALAQGIEPRHFAQGAAAGVCFALSKTAATSDEVSTYLRSLWQSQANQGDYNPGVADRLISLTCQAMEHHS